MLKHWGTHAEYQHFISEAVASLNQSQLKKFYSLSDSLYKLTSLNLDPVGQFLALLYSNTGRPALNQPQILRSFILMLDQGFTSLSNWVNVLASDDLLALLIGCTPDRLPPLGSYFDFINRLWLLSPDLQKSGRKNLFPETKNKKPSSKPGKGKKLPNRHPGITKKIAAYAQSEREFPFHYEKILQQLFAIIAVVPSLELALIPDSATISGDGTCVHSHANPYGHKVCNCSQNGIHSCHCDRHYSDPDASWGWDSDLNAFFFGHTLYMLSFYNEDYQVDLPLHIRFLDARRHDSISGLIALSEFRHLNTGITIQNLCFDSANDNYPTYELCKEWGIHPFIDLNDSTGPSPSIPDALSIDKDGTPLCSAGLRMINWGYDSGRHRRKWRCPAACGKVDSCPSKDTCSTSPYGRCIYTKPDWDIRLYTPVPRGTDEYKKVYNHRTSSERRNNRILNDYHLHSMKIHGKKRYSFFTMIAGINIHLDARLKKRKTDAA